MAGINITLNGDAHEVHSEIKLDQLLELFSLPKKRIAIELNNHVVRHADWPKTAVSEGDAIEVVHFVGGG